MLRIGNNIATRLEELCARVVEVARKIPNEPALRHVPGQMVRASSSAGANYEEARAAQSRADFVHKVSLAAKEMREALFWIRFVRALGSTTPELDPTLIEKVMREGTELAAILSASARTARLNAKENGPL